MTGLPPHYDVPHEFPLAIQICDGLRPESNFKVPQQILKIIEKCWDKDPSKRPKANELHGKFKKLEKDHEDKNSLIYKQFQETDKINKQFSSEISYTTHQGYTSKRLDFKNLLENNNSDTLGEECSEHLRIDLS
ncbi:14427_t:CDS:2 [Funneliformis mosseae]|uniref:14427_t:CDS:1 n=1 Tax=Funneliformis mosseae TaxID=27381 RepID=A0A9N9FRJ0_FUNMO|nr:14427_t:CDS:2 [Funneliformis mosseae]